MGEARWIDPTPLDHFGQLGEAQCENWRQQGFALVDHLLPQDVVQSLAVAAAEYFPEPNTESASAHISFGSEQHFVFPAEERACNTLTLHPALLSSVAKLLDVPVLDIRLTQSDVWPKYGRRANDDAEDNNDQRIHVDYPNHSLVHPPPWSSPEAVEIIVFLSDFEDCGGATAVVPRQGAEDPAYAWPLTRTPGVAGLDYVNNREVAEAYLRDRDPTLAGFRQAHLYDREVRVRYKLGTVLFYRHDVWHRGTPVDPGRRRMVQNLTFKLWDSQWVHTLHPGWTWGMYQPSKTMERLIAQSSVEQRTVLGFPPPGHRYWCEETVAAVEARYAAYGMDMTPYVSALN